MESWQILHTIARQEAAQRARDGEARYVLRASPRNPKPGWARSGPGDSEGRANEGFGDHAPGRTPLTHPCC